MADMVIQRTTQRRNIFEILKSARSTKVPPTCNFKRSRSIFCNKRGKEKSMNRPVHFQVKSLLVSLLIITAVLSLPLTSLGTGQAAAQKAPAVPRLSNGKPDFTGVW